MHWSPYNKKCNEILLMGLGSPRVGTRLCTSDRYSPKGHCGSQTIQPVHYFSFLIFFWYVKITYFLSFIFQSQIMEGINIIFPMMVFHHILLNLFYHHLMVFWSFLNGFICKFPSHMWLSSNSVTTLLALPLSGEITVSAGSVSPKDSFIGFQKTVFSQCPHVVVPPYEYVPSSPLLIRKLLRWD